MQSAWRLPLRAPAFAIKCTVLAARVGLCALRAEEKYLSGGRYRHRSSLSDTWSRQAAATPCNAHRRRGHSTAHAKACGRGRQLSRTGYLLFMTSQQAMLVF
eukprot:1512770-Rhodomonas_salina.2